MKAMVLTGIRKMEMREMPDPKLKEDTSVLLGIETVGVCGSDVHYYTTGRIGSQIVEYPYRVGHECSGTVKEVGSAVARLKPGDRVAVDPAQSCGQCYQCRIGRPHTCRDLLFLGTPGQGDGCLCEYIVMPEESCCPVGPNTTFEQAAVAEPLSIGVYSVSLSVPMARARIAILGCGPIGMSVLLPALIQGPRSVYVTDKINARLDMARQACATRAGPSPELWTGNPDTDDVVSEITEREPDLLDAVFECCGQQEALDQAVDLLRPGGKLVLIGIPELDRVSFSIDEIRRKEICIQNIRRQNGCVQAAVDLIERGNVDVDSMITHRFTLERSKEAFDLVAGYRDGVMKAMISLEGSS